MFEGFDTRTVPGQVDIHVRVGGQGPAVLLLHGYPQNVFEWAHVAPLLATRYTVVCADLRGYGQSGKPAGDMHTYSFRSMAADQLAMMKSLGFERFHLIGHDRGARVSHRMALDHPQAVRTLALLDIAPTLDVFGHTNAEVARSYWHWFFLQTPSPYPETLIEANPDHFFQGFFFALGAMSLDDLDPAQLAAYRAAWRDPAFIRASCADYRSAASVDCELDREDLARQVACPAFVVWGSGGVLPRLFDLRALWSARLARPQFAEIEGGHFFVDQRPAETAQLLGRFLDTCESESESESASAL